MPKTTKPFDWEVYDENGEFIDILSMTRDEMKRYKNKHSKYTLNELGYTDDGKNNSCDFNSEKRRDVHNIRVSRR